MGRTATVHFVTLRNCLVNLPLSITGPLSQRGVAPQSIAVQLSFRSASTGTQTVVAGWTGLPASIDSVSSRVSRGTTSTDRLEIDPQFAQMISPALAEGTTVAIELLRELPVANTVNVTPLTADDWEILESNAEFVEMFLLNQVRVVKLGMTVGCWINSSTVVKFLVDSTAPEPSTASSSLLLTSSTELIVAPKSRHAPTTPTPAKTHDLASVATASNQLEWDHLRRKLLRLLPLSLESRIHEASLEGNPTGEEIYLNRVLCNKLYRIWGGHKLTIAVQPRPKNPSSANQTADDSSASAIPSGSTSTGTNVGDHHQKPKDATSENDKTRTIEVRIRESSIVKEGQVWIGKSLRHQLELMTGDKDGAFELLKLGPPVSASNKKSGKGQEVAQSPKANGHSSSRPNGVPVQTATTLAGVDAQLASLTSHVVNSLVSRQLATASPANNSGGRTVASGVLVTGASGAGKTALIKEIGRRLSDDLRTLTHSIYIDCSKHSEERPVNLKHRIKDWFDTACWHSPSLLLLDNLDRLIPAEVEHADSFNSLHLANTFVGLAQSALESRPVVVIATAQGTTSMHPLLTSTHLLGETVSLKGPTKAGRKDIVNSLIRTKLGNSSLTLDAKFNAASIAAITEGYLPADLKDFVDRAVHQSAIRTMASATSPGSDLVLTADDFNKAQIGFVPLSLREVKLQKSDVQWSDIGGLHETRKTLRETLEWPTKYGAIFASCPLRLRSGLLLYGYPGCGKTLLASAVAKECGLNFISVKGPEILNKYIGASEKSVRDLFDRAQAAKPCVLFFDEFDSIAPKRGHDSTGVTDRVVNQMLTQMDGAEGLDGVYVLAATSRPDLIDPALLRPGRLDKSLLCDMPSYSDRLEIMQACSRKLHLSSSISLEEFAETTQGYSGADLQALMYNAHLDAIHSGLNADQDAAEDVDTAKKGEQDNQIKFVEISGNGKEGGGVRSKAEQAVVNKRLEQILASLKEAKRASSKKSMLEKSQGVSTGRKPTIVEPHHLKKSLDSTRPSVPADELRRLQKIYNDFVSTRSKGGLPSGEASDQVGGRASLM
ncbi:AAA family ATPase peroxin 1 [Sporobolomyces koalae]|uniref:AAA family ATPase peroxin 1 n=1 Tax=Sporobolomyces koalae TaxID=500713 RepID=UPI0031720805